MLPVETRGAIVLCGGQSSRMGRDKATLPFGPDETLLQRVVRTLGDVVPSEWIVCAAAAGQPLPPLPAEVRVVFDRQPDGGPMAGLVAGLAALDGQVEAAFVTSCDAPLLVPDFVRRMFELLGDDVVADIAAPHDGQRFHPLAAVYRIDVLPVAEAQLESDDRSLAALLDTCLTRRVPVDELRGVDPGLLSLATCNTPEEYERALKSI
jgi:molybdenum cofactor guanylyltransferase